MPGVTLTPITLRRSRFPGKPGRKPDSTGLHTGLTTARMSPAPPTAQSQKIISSAASDYQYALSAPNRTTIQRKNDSHKDCRLHCERKTRLEPAVAGILAPVNDPSVLPVVGQLPYDRGAFGVARSGRRRYMKPEPATFRLPVCFQSGKRDSNSRPRPWQGRALPTELFPQNRFCSDTGLQMYYKNFYHQNFFHTKRKKPPREHPAVNAAGAESYPMASVLRLPGCSRDGSRSASASWPRGRS